MGEWRDAPITTQDPNHSIVGVEVGLMFHHQNVVLSTIDSRDKPRFLPDSRSRRIPVKMIAQCKTSRSFFEFVTESSLENIFSLLVPGIIYQQGAAHHSEDPPGSGPILHSSHQPRAKIKSMPLSGLGRALPNANDVGLISLPQNPARDAFPHFHVTEALSTCGTE